MGDAAGSGVVPILTGLQRQAVGIATETSLGGVQGSGSSQIPGLDRPGTEGRTGEEKRQVW